VTRAGYWTSRQPSRTVIMSARFWREESAFRRPTNSRSLALLVMTVKENVSPYSAMLSCCPHKKVAGRTVRPLFTYFSDTTKSAQTNRGGTRSSEPSRHSARLTKPSEVRKFCRAADALSSSADPTGTVRHLAPAQSIRGTAAGPEPLIPVRDRRRSRSIAVHARRCCT